MKHTILLALGLGLALALPVQAGKKNQAADPAKPKPTPEEVFKKKDKNSDGFLTKEEFVGKAKDAAKAEARFAKLDTNGDGKVTLEEFKACHKKKNK